MITRKDVQEAKIKTRSMAKEMNKVSLTEAKRNSRQKMLLKGTTTDNATSAVKDIYGNVNYNFFNCVILFVSVTYTLVC